MRYYFLDRYLHLYTLYFTGDNMQGINSDIYKSLVQLGDIGHDDTCDQSTLDRYMYVYVNVCERMKVWVWVIEFSIQMVNTQYYAESLPSPKIFLYH